KNLVTFDVFDPGKVRIIHGWVMDSARTAPLPSLPKPQSSSSFHRFRHSFHRSTSQMSRRDRDSGGRDRYDRDGGSRHRRSGFDREPSPKRSRKDEKPEPEEVQDAVPVAIESGRTESKLKSPDRKKESEKKSSEDRAEDVPRSDPAVLPRSRSNFQVLMASQSLFSLSYDILFDSFLLKEFLRVLTAVFIQCKQTFSSGLIQQECCLHDDNRKAGQVGRGFDRRANNERGWRDSKDERRERDRKSNTKGGDNWRHDGFHKMNDEARPPVRRRPSFREQKIPLDSENTDKPAMESNRSSHIDRPVSGGDRRDGRDRYPQRNRGAFLGRDREGHGGSNNMGRESFNGGRQSFNHPQSGRREEKWKHDLFEEATKSPTTKNDDDQIARVEALLAS
ncbi:hypothetical protein LINGRAHAP2_LOCUS35712, partial [Linum grandiflorum]